MDTKNVNVFLKSSLVNTPYDINDEFIKAVERIVRTSLEYRTIIADKRGNDNENSCDLLSEYDFSDKSTKLQMHHIIPLYDICRAAAEKLILDKQKNITTFDVANLVMQWHYENAFLYAFLSVSAHQLVHDGQYTVPMEHIKGNAKIIKETYYDCIASKYQEIVDSLCENV